MKKLMIVLALTLLLVSSVLTAETGTSITRDVDDLVRLYIDNSSTGADAAAGVKFVNGADDSLQVVVDKDGDAIFDINSEKEYRLYIGESEVAKITSNGIDADDLDEDVAAQDLFNTIGDGTNTYTADNTTDNILFTESELVTVDVNGSTGEITIGGTVSNNSTYFSGDGGDTQLDIDWSGWEDMTNGSVIWGNATDLNVTGAVEWQNADALDSNGDINDFSNADDLDTSGSVAWGNSQCMDVDGYLDDVTVQDSDYLYFMPDGSSKAPGVTDEAGSWRIYSDASNNLVFEYTPDGTTWNEKQRIVQ